MYTHKTKDKYHLSIGFAFMILALLWLFKSRLMAESIQYLQKSSWLKKKSLWVNGKKCIGYDSSMNISYPKFRQRERKNEKQK